jgi:lipopolysaccharide/colanic/teichoic acid biosynthesis glycosyltransferase
MHRGIKRFIDIALALALLIFNLPLMAVIAVLIKIPSRGQQSSGRPA